MSGLFGLQTILALILPKLIELGVDELEKVDVEPVVRAIIPGERLDDAAVSLVKEHMPKLIAGIREHTGEGAVTRIIDTIK